MKTVLYLAIAAAIHAFSTALMGGPAPEKVVALPLGPQPSAALVEDHP